MTTIPPICYHRTQGRRGHPRRLSYGADTAMDPNTITALAVTVLALAAILAGWIYLRRYLRDSTDAEMIGFVRMLVRAAEQQFLDNTERRAWAIAEAKKRFPAMPLDVLIAVLEAAVYDLNQDQTETQIAAAAMGAPFATAARTWTEAD